MGLAALRRVLEPRACTLDAFANRVVAVDANNLLWSFVTAMSARGEPPRGPAGQDVSHAIGLVNRLKLYAEHGIRSAWVFDGEQPGLKDATLAARWDRIHAARDAGDVAQGAALTREQIADAKRLLTALGVPWMVAPGESDAQCAHFTRTGAAWAAVTQDYDVALHGAPRAGRNLTGSKTRTPECLELAPALEKHALTRELLVDAAILIGTDYNDGVKGVGPVKALKLVREHGSADAALDALGASLDVDVAEVRGLFLAHPVDEAATLAFRAPDADAVAAELDACGLSRGRASAITALVAGLHG